ncbi:MAG: TRAP transporter substrate-binding protein [Pseudomonadota bacterium]
MKTRLTTALAVAALAVSTGFASAQTWNMATPYPDSNFHTQNIKMFIDEVEAATDLDITLHSNASLLKMPEIKRGVQTNQAQLGEILLSAYGNEDPMFRVDSIPFLAPGYVNGIKLWHLSKPVIEEKFRSQGLIPLFSVAWPGQGIYTAEPVESAADFEGVKFRAYNAATARLAELMGAVPTTVQAAEIPQAFATGIVSAMITSAATGVDSQSWDFANNYYNARAMNTKNLVFVNADAFNGLDEAAQAAIMAAAARAEVRGWLMSAEAEAATTARLAEEGMAVADPPAPLLEDLKAAGSTMSQEWLEDAGDEGKALLDAMNAN